MNRSELVKKTAELLKERDVRKHVGAQKSKLHITDDQGNSSTFTIKKESSNLLFTNQDIAKILDTMLEIVEDLIKNGEEISIHGFGSLGVHYRAPRTTYHPGTKDPVIVPGRYVPKFNFGNDLRMAAKVYELSLWEKTEEDDE